MTIRRATDVASLLRAELAEVRRQMLLIQAEARGLSVVLEESAA